MDQGLTDLKQAMDDLNFDTARELAAAYVPANPDKFTPFLALVSTADDEEAARKQVIAKVEKARAAGEVEDQYLAEAFHLYRWDPIHITGSFQPTVRNELAPVQPVVRNHK